MIPSVFISSTVTDLIHLRDAIRDAVLEIGYRPTMSEYGEIGYLPSNSAVGSCYEEVGRSQILVLIVGKRYGSLKGMQVSVTHGEFRAAREASIPVVTLADKEVLSFQTVYKENAAAEIKTRFPGMDDPDGTFAMLDEIASSEVNNGILGFHSVPNARELLKAQLAHYVGDLLTRHTSPFGASIQDALAEVRSLRHEISKLSKSDPKPFLRAMSFIMGEGRGSLGELSEHVFGDLDRAAMTLLSSRSFREYLDTSGWKVFVVDGEIRFNKLADCGVSGRMTKAKNWAVTVGEGDQDDWAGYAVTVDNELVINRRALEIFETAFESKKSGWTANKAMQTDTILQHR